MAIVNRVGNLVLLTYQGVSRRHNIQKHEPDLPKFQNINLIRREITRCILPVFRLGRERLKRGFTFVCGMFDFESCWRCSTSRVGNRVDRGIGYFKDRHGRYLMTVPAHLCEICLSYVMT